MLDITRLYFHVEVSNDKNDKKKQNDDDDDGDDVDDDFLDLVARSNIPQPNVSEKQLRSDMEDENLQDTQEEQKKETR